MLMPTLCSSKVWQGIWHVMVFFAFFYYYLVSTLKILSHIANWHPILYSFPTQPKTTLPILVPWEKSVCQKNLGQKNISSAMVPVIYILFCLLIIFGTEASACLWLPFLFLPKWQMYILYQMGIIWVSSSLFFGIWKISWEIGWLDSQLISDRNK